MPQEGYRNPWVMHGILSVAALHKAYLAPNQRKTYLALSDYHQTIGSEDFRLQLAKLTRENWSPVFSFASTIPLYMMCSPSRGAGLRVDDLVLSMLELIKLIRGIRNLLNPILPRIYHSKFVPLMFGTWKEDDESTPDR